MKFFNSILKFNIITDEKTSLESDNLTLDLRIIGQSILYNINYLNFGKSIENYEIDGSFIFESTLLRVRNRLI